MEARIVFLTWRKDKDSFAKYIGLAPDERCVAALQLCVGWRPMVMFFGEKKSSIFLAKKLKKNFISCAMETAVFAEASLKKRKCKWGFL